MSAGPGPALGELEGGYLFCPTSRRRGRYSWVKRIGYNPGYTVSMKTAVSVPDDLFRLADAAARRLRVSRSQLLAHQLHHTLGEPSLRKFDEGIDRSSAILADGFPARLRDRSYPHLNLVDLRAADQGFDFAWRNLKIDHGTVAHIGAPAWQAVCLLNL